MGEIIPEKNWERVCWSETTEFAIADMFKFRIFREKERRESDSAGERRGIEVEIYSQGCFFRRYRTYLYFLINFIFSVDVI